MHASLLENSFAAAFFPKCFDYIALKEREGGGRGREREGGGERGGEGRESTTRPLRGFCTVRAKRNNSIGKSLPHGDIVEVNPSPGVSFHKCCIRWLWLSKTSPFSGLLVAEKLTLLSVSPLTSLFFLSLAMSISIMLFFVTRFVALTALFS